MSILVKKWNLKFINIKANLKYKSNQINSSKWRNIKANKTKVKLAREFSQSYYKVVIILFEIQTLD
jgi:hypothetical protein